MTTKKATTKSRKKAKEIVQVAPQAWVVDGERYSDLGEAQKAASA